MQTATSETESKSFDLSICVHHYTLRAPCPKGHGILSTPSSPSVDAVRFASRRRRPFLWTTVQPHLQPHHFSLLLQHASLRRALPPALPPRNFPIAFISHPSRHHPTELRPFGLGG